MHLIPTDRALLAVTWPTAETHLRRPASRWAKSPSGRSSGRRESHSWGLGLQFPSLPSKEADGNGNGERLGFQRLSHISGPGKWPTAENHIPNAQSHPLGFCLSPCLQAGKHQLQSPFSGSPAWDQKAGCGEERFPTLLGMGATGTEVLPRCNLQMGKRCGHPTWDV